MFTKGEQNGGSDGSIKWKVGHDCPNRSGVDKMIQILKRVGFIFLIKYESAVNISILIYPKKGPDWKLLTEDIEYIV